MPLHENTNILKFKFILRMMKYDIHFPNSNSGLISVFSRKLASDHHGISITSDLDNEESKEFGLIDFGSNIEGQMAMAKITISYTAYEGGQDSISLTGCKLTANCNSNFTIGDKYNINQGKKVFCIINNTLHWTDFHS